MILSHIGVLSGGTALAATVMLQLSIPALLAIVGVAIFHLRDGSLRFG